MQTNMNFTTLQFLRLLTAKYLFFSHCAPNLYMLPPSIELLLSISTVYINITL